MNVLVTGANGFVGSKLCEYLVKSGQTVIGLVRPISDLQFLRDLKSLHLLQGDITNKNDLVKAMKGVSIVYHVAAYTSDWGPWSTFNDVNIEGVRNVMEAALINKVKRVVHISTVSVYGFPGKENIDETTPLASIPDDPYITSKSEGEKIALSFNGKDIKVTVIRPAGIYGPNDRTTSLQMIPVLLKGGFGFVDGGKHLISPIYIDNLVQAIRLAGESEKAPGQAYNIVDDDQVTWREYIDWMCEDLNCKKPRLSAPAWVAWPLANVIENTAKFFKKKEAPLITRFRIRAVMRNNHYKTEKAKKELGYKPQVSTRKGVERTVKWYFDYVKNVT